MIRKILIVWLITSFCLVGCAVPSQVVPMNAKDRKEIKSISVKPVVGNNDTFVNVNNVLQGFGLIGMTISDMDNARSTKEINNLEKANHISPKKILETALNQDIKRKTNYIIKNNAKDADAVFIAEIEQQAIHRYNPLKPYYYVALSVKAKLVKNNKIIWQDLASNYLGMKNKHPGYSYSQLLRNPALVKRMWIEAAEFTSKDLMKKLQTASQQKRSI